MEPTSARLSDRTQCAQPPRTTVDLLERIAQCLEAIDSKVDEFAGALLNAKFPYGQPTDRWARRRR